jgi:hypothetical protein
LWRGEPCGNQAHVITAVGIGDNDDAAQGIKTDRDESLLVLSQIIDRDGCWIEQHALGIGEADAMLAQVRLSLGWIPNGLHICIICIYAFGSKLNTPTFCDMRNNPLWCRPSPLNS